MVIRAANGDLLYGWFEGSVATVDIGERTYATYGELSLTFTGGTGRFTHATGGAVLTFILDPETFAHTASLEGKLKY